MDELDAKIQRRTPPGSFLSKQKSSLKAKGRGKQKGKSSKKGKQQNWNARGFYFLAKLQ